MRYQHWIVISLLLASPALARAELRFARPAADLGELRGGPAYQHRFDFVNDSTQPIEITDIRLGCGCLQPVLDKRTVQAGEKGTLLMHIRTLGQQNGARTWQARVQYRQADASHETTLIIGATLRNEVTVEPSILAISVETTVQQEVTITDHRAVPMKITAVTASSPAIRVRSQTQGNATRIMLEISGATLTAARQEETLNIYTDDPLYRQLQVPITLTRAVRAEVSATPAEVEMQGAGSKLVRLRATGGRAVRVESAAADHPAIKCTWASGPDNDATLKITVNAEQLSGVTTLASVRVRILEPVPTTLTIPVVLRKE